MRDIALFRWRLTNARFAGICAIAMLVATAYWFRVVIGWWAWQALVELGWYLYRLNPP